MLVWRLLGCLASLVPTMAAAQALQCAVPATLDRPHADLPSERQPKRILPIGGYTLALTWAPEYCHGNSRQPSARFECGGGNKFGFVLHGLWPDGTGKDWPQYCAATDILPQATIAKNMCATPSAQLLQHEWAKHGTCTGLAPDAYFARSTGLYAKLRYPDMNALSRGSVTAGALADAFAKANPGVPASAIRVTANKRGWFDELWLCLDMGLRYTACRADSGGVVPSTAIKIWRGERSYYRSNRPSRSRDDAYRGGA